MDKMYQDSHKSRREEFSLPGSPAKVELLAKDMLKKVPKVSTPPENYSIKNTKTSIKYYSSENSLEEKPMERKRRPLKAVIKEVKWRAIENLENNYSHSDPKRTPLVFLLVKHYLKTDILKAKEILIASVLPESKFLLVQIWREMNDKEGFKKYSAYLDPIKWTCKLSGPKKIKTAIVVKTPLETKIESKCPAEQKVPNFGWLKHSQLNLGLDS